MLDKPVEEIIYEGGKAVGVKSQGEVSVCGRQVTGRGGRQVTGRVVCVRTQGGVWGVCVRTQGDVWRVDLYREVFRVSLLCPYRLPSASV